MFTAFSVGIFFATLAVWMLIWTKLWEGPARWLVGENNSRGVIRLVGFLLAWVIVPAVCMLPLWLAFGAGGPVVAGLVFFLGAPIVGTFTWLAFILFDKGATS